MAMYCTIDEAKSAGATGSDAEITAAIEAASSRVERYTSEVFAPIEKTKRVVVGRSGVALVHERIVSIDSVTYVGAQTPIDASGYRVDSSSIEGAQDAIALVGALSWADATVSGAEPWNGGWAGLAKSYGDTQIDVAGTFGWTATPVDVSRATALVAAVLRGADLTPETPTPTQSDNEGNVLPVVPPFDDDAASGLLQRTLAAGRLRDLTTGSVEADALLASFVREPVRMRA